MQFVSNIFMFFSLAFAVHAASGIQAAERESAAILWSEPKRLVTVDQIWPFVEKASQALAGTLGEVDLRDVKEEETLEWQIDNGVVTPQIFSVGDQWIVKVAQTEERGLGEIEGSQRASRQLDGSKRKDSFLFIFFMTRYRSPFYQKQQKN